MKSEDVCMCVGLGRWVEGPGGGGPGGGGGLVGSLYGVSDTGWQGGGVSPFLTSILRHKFGNASRVKIHSVYYRDLIRKNYFT